MDAAEEGEDAAGVAIAVFVVEEAAQVEEVGFGRGVDVILLVLPFADGVVAVQDGGELAVEGEVAVFDVAVFVGDDGLEFVAAEAVQRALADGEREAVVRAAEDEGVDAHVAAVDVGLWRRVAGGSAHFGDEVGVAAVARVVVTGGFGAQRPRLFARAAFAHFAPCVAVGEQHDAGRDEADGKADPKVAAGKVRAAVGGDEGRDAKEGQRAGEAVAEVAGKRREPEGEVEAAAGGGRLAVFGAEGGHSGSLKSLMVRQRNGFLPSPQPLSRPADERGAVALVEFDLYRLAFFGDVFDFQQFGDAEAEHARDDVGRELFDGAVVFGDAVVVVLAREGDAVFGRGDFFAQRGELVVRLEVGVVLEGGVEAAEACAQGLFGRGECAHAGAAAAAFGVFQGVGGVVARGDDRGQRFLFVLQVFARDFDEVRDEVVAAGELDVNLRESVFRVVAVVDEAVVNGDARNDSEDDKGEDNPANHGFSPVCSMGFPHCNERSSGLQVGGLLFRIRALSSPGNR